MRTVVLTGVSRGLGAALFDQLYDRGARILALGRSFSASQRELATADPDRVLLRHTELTDPLGQPDAVELAGFLRGHAVLLLNAATIEPIGAIGALAPAELVAAVAVNLTAPMVLANAFLAATGPDRRTVLFVSSGAAHRPIGGWAAYCATKAGAEMFIRVLAEQLADDPTGTVAVVDPGLMDTGMQAEIRTAHASPRYFPGGQRWQDSYAKDQLAAPERVAEKIIARHLTAE